MPYLANFIYKTCIYLFTLQRKDALCHKFNYMKSQNIKNKINYFFTFFNLCITKLVSMRGLMPASFIFYLLYYDKEIASLFLLIMYVYPLLATYDYLHVNKNYYLIKHPFCYKIARICLFLVILGFAYLILVHVCSLIMPLFSELKDIIKKKY